MAKVFIAKNNLNYSRDRFGSCGTNIAALAAGNSSSPYDKCEKFNGTSWSTTSVMLIGATETAMCGTQDAALLTGGWATGSSWTTTTYLFNGTTWTTGNDIGAAKVCHGMAGTQVAGLAFAGYSGNMSATYEYNGGSWSASSSCLLAVMRIAGAGSQTAAFKSHGDTGYEGTAPTNYSEQYDGTVWHNCMPALIRKEYQGVSGTLNTGILSIGGKIGTTTVTYNNIMSTEEFVSDIWTIGMNYPSVYSIGVGGCGTFNEGLFFGGRNSSSITLTTYEVYSAYPSLGDSDYSSFYGTWRIVSGFSTPRDFCSASGKLNSCLVAGGMTSDTAFALNTDLFNGTNWTAETSLPSARASYTFYGVEYASVITGGQDTSSTYLSSSLEYNGSTWSAGGSISEALYLISGCGILDAGLTTGGFTGSLIRNTSYEYNGTAYSSGGTMISNRIWHGCCGTQTASLVSGGYNGSSWISLSEEYDGSSWANGGSLISSPSPYCTLNGIQTDAKCLFAYYVTNSYNGTSWTSDRNFPFYNSLNAMQGSSSLESIVSGGKYSAYFMYDAAIFEKDYNKAAILSLQQTVFDSINLYWYQRR